MPRSLHYPVFLWRDHQAGWTARLVEGDAPAGFGPTAARALEQLDDYLRWQLGEDELAAEPDFLDAELLVFRVAIRPEYQSAGRRYPCDEAVTLRVHAVRGRQEHGLLVCSLPILDVRFYYYEASALRNLVTHYVQQRLEGVTPAQLARLLAPAEARLEKLTVTARGRRGRGDDAAPRHATLAGVAEALGDPYFRRQFAKPYERDKQVASLVERLTREKTNILLVGEPGSGKTTVLVDAVRQLERGGAAGRRAARRFWQTSGGRLIAGMKYLGQWEERCEALVAEVAQIEGGYLCAENLLELVRLGGAAPTNSLAAFFLPYLARGELSLIAEASPAEVDACRRLLPGLVDVFEVVRLEPMTRQEAINVLEFLAGSLKVNYHVEVGRGVVALVYHLFRRFVPYGAFPGKAASFLTAAFDAARQQKQEVVDVELIIGLFIRQTGLPELFLRDEVPLRREEVLADFRARIIDQEEACQAAAALVTTFKGGLNDPGRPIGVLLFCGPTGVGKTEMARAVSRYFFGHGEEGERMVRLDMSEYTGWRAGERLLLGPDGEPSELIRKVRQQPFLVVLLDEIEKADAEVFDVLLGAFDEGRLTDRYGRVTSFKSAILIMTSNLGAGRREAFGFGPSAGPAYVSEARAFFRPELFNRIDAVVTFAPLGEGSIRAITRKELQAIAAREGLARVGVRLSWSEELERHLARRGFDARYGARPLQRALEALVVVPLSRYLLDRPEARDALIHLGLSEAGEVTIG